MIFMSYCCYKNHCLSCCFYNLSLNGHDSATEFFLKFPKNSNFISFKFPSILKEIFNDLWYFIVLLNLEVIPIHENMYLNLTFCGPMVLFCTSGTRMCEVKREKNHCEWLIFPSRHDSQIRRSKSVYLLILRLGRFLFLKL